LNDRDDQQAQRANYIKQVDCEEDHSEIVLEIAGSMEHHMYKPAYQGSIPSFAPTLRQLNLQATKPIHKNSHSQGAFESFPHAKQLTNMTTMPGLKK
jgi:hypothetical protein